MTFNQLLEKSLKLGVWTLEQRLKKVIKELNSIDNLWSVTDVDESHTEESDQSAELAESEDLEAPREDPGFSSNQREESTTTTGSGDDDVGPRHDASAVEAVNYI